MIYFNVSLYARLKLFLVDISSQLKNCLKTDIIAGLLWGIPRSEGGEGYMIEYNLEKMISWQI